MGIGSAQESVQEILNCTEMQEIPLFPNGISVVTIVHSCFTHWFGLGEGVDL